MPAIIHGGIRPGFNNAYTDGRAAIYCSPKFNTALSYAHGQSRVLNDSKLIVQCRVNPDPQILTKHNDSIWTVYDAAAIKPYRIIIKEWGFK